MSGAAAGRGVVSIQSHVAYGYVGNSAAVFALQRLGHPAWPVNVLEFSNHPGHGDHAGVVHPPALVRSLVDGLARRGVLAGCAAVLTGYLPDAALVGEAARALAAVHSTNPGALRVCDPVIGDEETGRYVADGVAEAIAESLVPLADLLLPNTFELTALTGRPAAGVARAIDAARALLARGPRRVIVTGLATGGERIATVLVEAAGAWSVSVPRLDLGRRPDGAGDLLAAVLTARLLDGMAAVDALALAMGAVHDVLARTAADGARELSLVAAQDSLARPACDAAVARLD